MQILDGQCAVVSSDLHERVNHCRIALQRHSLVQTVFENARDERPLVRLRSFSLNQRCKSHNGECRLCCTCRSRIGYGDRPPLFSELLHHLRGQVRCDWMPGQLIGCREQEPLQCLCIRGQIFDARWVFCGSQEVIRRHELRTFQILGDVEDCFTFAHGKGQFVDFTFCELPKNIL